MADTVRTVRAESSKDTLDKLIDDILSETSLTYTNETEPMPISRSLNDSSMDDEEDTIFKCLQGICEESLLAISFKNDGTLKAKNWMGDVDNTDFTEWTFNDFVKNSFDGSFEVHPKQTYNTFKFRFGWNPFKERYDFQVNVTNPGADSYSPAYTPGFLDKTGGMGERCWNLCHDAYIRTNNINTFDKEMKWHDETGDINTQSSASTMEYLIYQIIRWLSMPRRIVKFSYPMQSEGNYYYDAELMDRVTVNHPVYTDGDEYGWLVDKKVNIMDNTIKFSVIMQPQNWTETDYNVIIESGDRSDTIGETGSRIDQYDEKGIT